MEKNTFPNAIILFVPRQWNENIYTEYDEGKK